MTRRLLPLAVLTLSTLVAKAEASAPDSLLWNWVHLDSAAIAAFSPLIPSEQIAGSRWVTDSTLVNGFGAHDVSNALNQLPGVSMETRGDGGSRRLNVRGSSLRSPFAVRNTQLFMHGFLMTEADGTSPVEWIDPSWSGPIEIISGPAATTFGGAYGGALNVHGRPTPEGQWVQTTLGSTGSGGLQQQLSTGWKRQGLQVRASRQENSGYRDWEWSEKWQAEVECAWGTRAMKHHTWAGLLSANWALPGGIVATALPTNAPGEDYNAQVDRTRAFLAHHIHVPQVTNRQHRSSLDVWGLVRTTQKTNPFGTSPFFNGYKDESGWGGSLRARQRWAPWKLPVGSIQAEWNLLAVFDRNSLMAFEDPIEGTASPMLYDLWIRQQRAHWAPSVAWDAGQGWRVEAATALSQRQSMATGVAQDSSYTAPFNRTSILPRIGVSKALPSDVSVFFQTSTGFSDPTNFETLPLDEGFTGVQVLDSETAWSFEAGVRHPWGQLSMFHQFVQGPIAQVFDTLDVPSFVNGDEALVMNGVEWMAGHTWGAHRVQLNGNVLGLTQGGESIPGQAVWNANLNYHWQVMEGADDVNLHVWIRHRGGILLSQDSDEATAPVNVLNLQSTWNRRNEPWQVTVGVRNALNASYSGWVQANAPGDKFYNPAPPRTAFLSVRLTFNE